MFKHKSFSSIIRVSVSARALISSGGCNPSASLTKKDEWLERLVQIQQSPVESREVTSGE